MDSIPLSALQHYLFCPRQCGLIHIERDWDDNYFTAMGNIEHERVDSGVNETRGEIRVERNVHLQSSQYGIHGIADLVEYYGRKGKWSRIIPVEYKHGSPKEHRADEIQLCAQVICLEEMHDCSISCGSFFYRKTKRRLEIPMTDELRDLTHDIILKTREMIATGKTPSPSVGEYCKSCSLNELCLPDMMVKNKGRISTYLDELLTQNMEENR